MASITSLLNSLKKLKEDVGSSFDAGKSGSLANQFWTGSGGQALTDLQQGNFFNKARFQEPTTTPQVAANTALDLADKYIGKPVQFGNTAASNVGDLLRFTYGAATNTLANQPSFKTKQQYNQDVLDQSKRGINIATSIAGLNNPQIAASQVGIGGFMKTLPQFEQAGSNLQKLKFKEAAKAYLKVPEKFVQGGLESFSRGINVAGVVGPTQPLMDRVSPIITNSVMQKFGSSKVGQQIVQRSLDAILNILQGVPVNVALDREPVDVQSVIIDGLTGAFLSSNANSLLKGNKKQAVAEIQKAVDEVKLPAGYDMPQTSDMRSIVNEAPPEVIKNIETMDQAARLPKGLEMPTDPRMQQIVAETPQEVLDNIKRMEQPLDLNNRFSNMDMVYQNVKTGEAVIIPDNLKPLAAQMDSIGKNGDWHISSMEAGTAPEKLARGNWKVVGTADENFLKNLPLGETQVAREANMAIPQVKTKEGGVVRGLSQSVQETANPNISAETRALVNDTYIPKTNEKLMGEAKALLTEGASLDLNKVSGIDKKIAATIQEAINLDQAGDHEAAANLFNNLSRQGTELGRGVQAFSLLSKMSPEAISLSAAGRIRKYNETATRKIPELTGAQQQAISDAVKNIDTLTGREKNIAINELSDLINSYIPSTIVDKALTVWKAGLLTSLRTHERNLIGNTIQNVAEIAKDPFATAADILLSQKTGKRTVTTSLGGIGEAFSKKTQQQVADLVGRGFDPEQDISKFEVKKINWGNNKVEQALKAYTDTVFRVLSAEDKPFYNASFARSLYDQAGAEAINAGRQGDQTFIKELVANPTEDMLKTATIDADNATFHDKGKISEVASTLKRWASKNEISKAIVEVVAPFTGVPSSVAGKVIDYSPIGLVKGAMNAGRVLYGQVPELQRQASQEIGRGVIGSGLFGIGAYLMSKGLMTGQPKDATEANLWQAEGKQANSVLINGKWRSIGSVGPQNLILLAGAKFNEEMNRPEGSMGSYLATLGKDQLSQTFLSGVQQPLNAITDPQRYGKSYVGSLVSSAVPNIVKDVAKSLDPNAREVSSVQDYVAQSLPLVRNQLTPKRDVLGNIVPQEPTGAGAFLDLFNSKTPITNTVVDELSRLNSTGNPATPSKIQATQTIAGTKTKLTPQQLDAYEAGVSVDLQNRMAEMISSDNYKNMDDADKAKAIDNLVSTVRSNYKKANLDEIVSGAPISETKPAGELGLFTYVDDSGTYRTVDLSRPIKRPTYTGNAALDKKLKTTYKSAITSRETAIAKLYQDGKITEEQAVAELDKLDAMYKATGGKKLSVAKPKALTIRASAKVAPIKIASSAKARAKVLNLKKLNLTATKPTSKRVTPQQLAQAFAKITKVV